MERDETGEKIRRLYRQAGADSKYAELSREYCKLETWFSKRVQEMTEEEQNLFWGFICTAEAMNWRMLEILVETGI